MLQLAALEGSCLLLHGESGCKQLSSEAGAEIQKRGDNRPVEVAAEVVRGGRVMALSLS